MLLTAVMVSVALVGAPTDAERIKDALKHLGRCQDIHANVCIKAAATLTNMQDKAVGPTRKALRDMTLSGQILATSVFTSNESRKATSALIGVGLDRKLSGVVRNLAIASLVDREGGKVIKALCTALRDKDATVRAGAARALGTRPHGGNKKVMKALIKAARDEDKNVRIEALIGLGLSGQSMAGPALTKALKDVYKIVRLRALEGLRFVMFEPSIGPLIELLRSTDKHLIRMAAIALTKQTGEDFGEDHTRWKRWNDGREQAGRH